MVIEHFMTDTARCADIVLPATTQLEHFDVHSTWGHFYVMLNEPAVAPLGEAKSHGEIIRMVAERMGLNHPALHESDEEIAASALPPDLTLSHLKAARWVKHVALPRPYPGQEIPVTLAGYPVIPAPTNNGALQLLTPKAHYFLNSSFANMERHQNAEGKPALQMNSKDATQRSLSNGQCIIIQNGQGSLRATLRVNEHIFPGTVSLAGKWWFCPENTAAVGNVLTPAVWSATGQPAYNDTFVEVISAN